MRHWWSRQSVRLRLTVWYAGTLLVLLLLYGGSLFAFVWRGLSHDLDRRLQRDFEIAETMLERTPAGRVRWLGPLHDHVDEELGHQIWAEAWSPEGDLLFRSELPDSLALALTPPEWGLETIGRLSLSNSQKIRYYQGPHPIGGHPATIRVIQSEDPLRQTLARLALIELLALPFAAALAGLGGFALARRLLEPVARMTDRARAITADCLDERLPIHNPDDEFGHLADVFNKTFARLERSFEQLRRFTSDASHELRTPLTAMRSVGEVALREPRDERAYRETIGSMLEEVDRLARLTDNLLTLSRADDGRVALKLEPLDLGAFAREVAADMSLLAEEKGQLLAVEAPETVHVSADRAVLRCAVINLVDNAVKYSPQGSAIRLAVSQRQSAGVLEVIDRGHGIPAEQRECVFERFWRVDQSRSRPGGGSGLGLAIVRWAVEAHGGDIQLETEEGKGCVFRVTLPRATEREMNEI